LLVDLFETTRLVKQKKKKKKNKKNKKKKKKKHFKLTVNIIFSQALI
jgi:hypothetical protein